MKTMQSTANTMDQKRYVPASRRVHTVLSLVLLSIVLQCYPAAAVFKDWTAVGSTGTVDEGDRNIVDFSTIPGGIVSLKDDATGTLNIRYNVVSVEGLFGGNGVELGVRLRDDGPDARVVVRLKRFNLVNGDVDTILTLDSNDSGASNNFRLEIETACSLRFNFFDYAYFVDVTLTKTDTSGRPALAILQLASIVRCS